MHTLYTDEFILVGTDPTEIDAIIKRMSKEKFDIIGEGTLEVFLGVNIDRKPDGSIHLTQPHLIKSILGDLHLLGSEQ